MVQRTVQHIYAREFQIQIPNITDSSRKKNEKNQTTSLRPMNRISRTPQRKKSEHAKTSQNDDEKLILYTAITTHRKIHSTHTKTHTPSKNRYTPAENTVMTRQKSIRPSDDIKMLISPLRRNPHSSQSNVINEINFSNTPTR